MSSPLLDEIRTRLAALAPQVLELQDDSARHAGHAGAAGGGGHFNLRIVSNAFAGKSRVARHRDVYSQLADMIPARIHALAIDARTPDESASPLSSTKPEEPHET
ncbi:BolA family transcriptional regulator [Niveibacterium umoris]|uniref:BolA protein n=1 Tax=Niveibacterium umoris TaxID=1193620 RepID=A0A840BGQ3_9RHOO|nr:BolA protein [Niveibacterium umoris]